MHIVLVETTSVRGFDMVAEMADAGVEVSFVTGNLDAYRRNPGFELASRAARLVEVANPAAGRLAERLRGRLGPTRPDGVICRDEVHPFAVAELARDLGLPHESVAAARILADKSAVRARLTEHGVGSLRWRVAATEAEGLAAVDEIGLPVVVKPTAGGWSVGVTVAWSREDAARALAELLRVPAGRDGAPPRALVEEYAVGRHVSAELLVADGRTVLLGFAERLPAPTGQTAELGGHFPARLDQDAAARAFVLDAVRALGLRRSAVHAELLLTPTGPELIEFNGRIAGHVVTRQMSYALGRSLTRDLMALATGEPVEEAGPPESVVALHQLYSPVAAVVRGGKPADVLGPDVIETHLAVAPGDRVRALRTNHDRIGYVLARGATAQDAARTAAEAAGRLLASLELAPEAGAEAPGAAGDAGVAEGVRGAAGPAADPVTAAAPAVSPAVSEGSPSAGFTGGEHLLVLLGADDPVEATLTAVGAVTSRVSVVWTSGPEGEAEARALWARHCEGQWHTADTGPGIRAAARAVHAAEPVRGVLTLSATPYARQLRDGAPGPGARPGAPPVPGHTVVVTAHRDVVRALTVIDEEPGVRLCPTALDAGTRATLTERAVRAVREAGLDGVVRCFFPAGEAPDAGSGDAAGEDAPDEAAAAEVAPDEAAAAEVAPDEDAAGGTKTRRTGAGGGEDCVTGTGATTDDGTAKGGAQAGATADDGTADTETATSPTANHGTADGDTGTGATADRGTGGRAVADRGVADRGTGARAVADRGVADRGTGAPAVADRGVADRGTGRGAKAGGVAGGGPEGGRVGHGSAGPLLLPGLDEAVIDLHDAVHTRGLVAAVAEAALGRVPRGRVRDRVAAQHALALPAGPLRVVEASTAAELGARPDVFRARVLTRAGHVTGAGGPGTWLRHTVVADGHDAARAAADRLADSVVLRTAPHDRTHVLLLDRLGADAWTGADGSSPVLPADRFRLSVLTSAQDASGPADLVVRTDLYDDFALGHLARAVRAAHPVHRVAALSERLLEPAARLRRLLGVPGEGPEAVSRFIDKAVMKRLARRHGIRHADGLLAHTAEDVTTLFGRHGRIVVKPRAASGSQGVAVLSTRAELERWLGAHFVPGAFLCEEFVDAPMCHIDAVVHDGEPVWNVSAYVRDTMALRRGRPLSSATVADPAVRAAAGRLLAQVVDAWRVRSGVLHLEAFLTAGGLTFCEVAARPGGGGVVEAFLATDGVDLRHAKILADAGENPLAGRREPVAPYAGWTVHYCGGGRLLEYDDSAVAGDAHARTVRARVGDAVPASTFSGTGISTHVFVHDTPEGLAALVDRAEREVRIVTGPAAGEAGS
ncbi:ATP-grasp domain-containing protein [Streptomyces sp. PU10]|uniref:ATP-grasp domain-containing protein n=1 Tax=Streptomyces sp. PU10 TaxID=3062780 RepID=UPI0028FC3A57|nr:ATP-grasp domain-containing protein [Streptomyces sp. PU10]MDU0256429.1 ATP-grasp domain-containing protein [Streptomyces sp. PU10]